MIERLVVNGCSYMDVYVGGNGHKELGSQLNIPTVLSKAIPGASNQRIIRTTLEDCYNSDTPTLYVIGITFLHRFDLPIIASEHGMDKWQSFNNISLVDNQFPTFDANIALNDVIEYKKLLSKFRTCSGPEVSAECVLTLTSMVDSIINNGHTVVIFNTGDISFRKHTNQPMLQYINKNKHIIDSFKWLSNEYQFDMGARCDPIDIQRCLPIECRHVMRGDHQYLNEYLVNYIDKHNIMDLN